jgi:glycerol-3-phosphate dehydrogenase (NAD(P)+)
LELAQAKPTAVVLASDQKDIMDSVMQRFHGGNLRCYCTSSMATVQFCGVYKNILAVAAGISDGLELGANARSALITRGIAEMVRIAKSMGLATEPIMGLAGQGDVILSATSDLSRNRRLGLELGRGIDLATIGQQDGMSTLESLNNVAMMLDIAKESGIETPIAEGVNQIISESMSPSGVLTSLLARDPKFEQD